MGKNSSDVTNATTWFSWSTSGKCRILCRLNNRKSVSWSALTEAVILNYLALHNEKSRLDEVLPGHTIGTAAPSDDLIAFDKIRG